MYTTIFDLLANYMPSRLAQPVAYILTLAVIGLICLLARWITKAILVRLMSKIASRTKTKWDNILLEHKVYHRASNIAVPIIMTMFAAGMPQYGFLLNTAAQIVGVIVFLRVFIVFTGSVDAIYNLYDIAKTRPIRSLLQVIQVGAYIVSGVVVVALLAGESPLVLLGGIGAATAVTSFIFKDAILGFVAGVQLTANDLIRIGDWIEVPKHSADGTVVDLSMTTVKVENFDKTITSIPAYSMVSDAFINWRGMESSGGRRIKRAVYIDAAGVCLCDDEMIARFRNMHLLREYIDNKLDEIARYNHQREYDLSEPVNGRRITNVGTFRAYILAYLKQHPGIHKGMTTMVRQLAPDDRGLPLEIYTFTNTTEWAKYENIQSDIFDHLYSVVSEFGLRIYQRPSSSDIRSLSSAKTIIDTEE